MKHSTADLTTKYRIVGRNGQSILIHQDKPRWLAVNGSAARISHQLQAGENPGRIAQDLAGGTGESSERVRLDVRAFIDDLIRAGFVGARSENEAVTGRQLRRLQINLTNRCNLSCRHCGAVANTPADLPYALGVDLIDQAAGFEDAAVAFSGGEPFLWDGASELFAYAAGRLRTAVTTNGLLISELPLSKIPAGIEWQVSLDGQDQTAHEFLRGPDTFKPAKKALGLLAEMGAECTVYATITRENASPERMIEICAGLGVKEVRFSALQKVGRAAARWADLSPSIHQYESVYRRLYLEKSISDIKVHPGLAGLVFDFPPDGHWCRLGESLLVDADGSIFPCSLLKHPDFKLGDVREMTVAQAMDSTKLKALVYASRRRWRESGPCCDCVWRAFCQAGCPGQMFWETGDIGGIDQFCRLRTELYEALLFRASAKSSERNGV